MFEFLKDFNCPSEDSVFHQLIASVTTALTSQANASFLIAGFLQQVWKELYVSHVLGSTHPSFEHTLLSKPSTSTLFSKEVICALPTQVKDDSQLSLLKNLSSLKGGSKSASTSSKSAYRHRDSSSSSSSSCGRGFSRSYRGSRCPASSSPSRWSKVAFKGILHSPTSKKIFLK